MLLPGRPFTLQTPIEIVNDLHDRLRRTRFPAEQITADWRFGPPLGYMRKLRDYWLEEFDWASWEARINRFTQRIVDVDGYPIHVFVEPGSGPNPLPIILTHGWPGCCLEFIDLIEPLAHPERFGGNEADSFTVIVPSMPGYGFSPAPPAPIPPKEIARLWNTMMTQSFGFGRYAAQGGDWGGVVTANLALHFPEKLVAIHLNMGGLIPHLDAQTPALSEAEAAWAAQSADVQKAKGGYQIVQGTKPQSLAYAQTDSPLGLAAWLVEKFQDWTVKDETVEPPFSMDRLLANVMLYWLGGSNAPSWLYIFLLRFQDFVVPQDMRIEVPTGLSLFPGDFMPPPPASWIARSTNLRTYHVMEGGGHFPAMEVGNVLIREMTDFFRDFR